MVLTLATTVPNCSLLQSIWKDIWLVIIVNSSDVWCPSKYTSIPLNPICISPWSAWILLGARESLSAWMLACLQGYIGFHHAAPQSYVTVQVASYIALRYRCVVASFWSCVCLRSKWNLWMRQHYYGQNCCRKVIAPPQWRHQLLYKMKSGHDLEIAKTRK